MKADVNDSFLEQELSDILNEELAAAGISVSEELIARTLAAVRLGTGGADKEAAKQEKAREDNAAAAAVETAGKFQGKRRRNLWYTLGTLAAACLVLVCGVRVFGLLGIFNASEDMEHAPDSANYAADADAAGGRENDIATSETNDESRSITDSDGSMAETEQPSMADGAPSDNTLPYEAEPMDGGDPHEESTGTNWISNFDSLALAQAVAAGAANADRIDALQSEAGRISLEEDVFTAANYVFSEISCEGAVTDAGAVTKLLTALESADRTEQDTALPEESEVSYRFLILKANGETVYFRLMHNGTVQQAVLLEDGALSAYVTYQAGDGEAYLKTVTEWLEDNGY